MKITYDKMVDAMYVYTGIKTKIDHTVEINDRLLVDVDKDGQVVGIEILDASSREGLKSLEKSIKKGIPVKFLTGQLLTA